MLNLRVTYCWLCVNMQMLILRIPIFLFRMIISRFNPKSLINFFQMTTINFLQLKRTTVLSMIMIGLTVQIITLVSFYFFINILFMSYVYFYLFVIQHYSFLFFLNYLWKNILLAYWLHLTIVKTSHWIYSLLQLQ